MFGDVSELCNNNLELVQRPSRCSIYALRWRASTLWGFPLWGKFKEVTAVIKFPLHSVLSSFIGLISGLWIYPGYLVGRYHIVVRERERERRKNPPAPLEVLANWGFEYGRRKLQQHWLTACLSTGLTVTSQVLDQRGCCWLRIGLQAAESALLSTLRTRNVSVLSVWIWTESGWPPWLCLHASLQRKLAARGPWVLNSHPCSMCSCLS